jgi:AcrR family transcriptional regulator/DNA-binding MarR family transcriptional regulator
VGTVVMPSRARIAADRGRGRGGLAEIQRARMIAALAEVARERGVVATTVAHVVARSGVSRRTFYELFEDREDCFRAAFDQAVEHAAQRVVPAFRAGRSWRERIRGGLGALLEFLEDEPDLGALCVVDALGAGRQALDRRAEVVGVLIDAVDEGRVEVKGRLSPTRLTSEAVVGAVLAVLHARLVAGDGDGRSARQPVADLLGPLVGIVVLPYLGQAAAAREAAIPMPARARAEPAGGDPLRDLNMRLTYRTVRVLVAIAGNSGASNREVADASGVQDQGQISKLLARLEHLGLIHNRGAGLSRGEPNAWRLTGKGEAVERAIRQQTAPGGLDV